MSESLQSTATAGGLSLPPIENIQKKTCTKNVKTRGKDNQTHKQKGSLVKKDAVNNNERKRTKQMTIKRNQPTFSLKNQAKFGLVYRR